MMTTATHRSVLTGMLLGVLLVLVSGCSDQTFVGDYPVRDLTITMKCGTDVRLRFNVSGHIGLRTQDMLASKCNLQGNGNNMTIQCPGNGLNWTQLSQEQLGRLVARNPYASPVPQAAERNFSDSAR